MAEKDRLLREADLIRQQANISLKESMMNASFGSHGGKVDPDEVKVKIPDDCLLHKKSTIHTHFKVDASKQGLADLEQVLTLYDHSYAHNCPFL